MTEIIVDIFVGNKSFVFLDLNHEKIVCTVLLMDIVGMPLDIRLSCGVFFAPCAVEQHDASHPSRCFANNREEKYPKLYLVLNCFLSSSSSLAF